MSYPWLNEYLMSKKGVTKDFKEEWQWTRYFIGGKMYAAICKNESGRDYLITIKLNPMDGEFLREQYNDITPGYYMNKIHWNSVNMDGVVPDEVLRDMIDKSYKLVFKGLTQKLQHEITR